MDELKNQMGGGKQFAKNLLGKLIQAQTPRVSNEELEINRQAKGKLRDFKNTIYNAENGGSENDGILACKKLLEILEQVKPELLKIIDDADFEDPIHIEGTMNLIKEMIGKTKSPSPARFHNITQYIYPCVDYLLKQETFLKENIYI